jgi:uncharacterized protein YcbX
VDGHEPLLAHPDGNGRQGLQRVAGATGRTVTLGRMQSVARLSIAPVKSMALQHPEQVRLEPFGVLENRRFYLTEPDGRLVSGAQYGSLMRIRADYDASRDWLSLGFPDGSLVEGEAEVLGDPVSTSLWGRPVSGREVMGPWANAISSFLGRPVLVVKPDRLGDANDETPVSLMSTASADELARQAGRSTSVDGRRFRMLVELAGCEPHEEDTWGGRRLRIGQAVVRVGGPIPRCVVTTLHPDVGIKDFDTLKAIAAYRGVTPDRDINFGVYAEVVEPGTIGVGDEVALLDGEQMAS